MICLSCAPARRAIPRNWRECCGEAFAILGIDETRDEARYRIASCYLADIAGARIPIFAPSKVCRSSPMPALSGYRMRGAPIWHWRIIHRYQGLGSKVKDAGNRRAWRRRAYWSARVLAAPSSACSTCFSASQPGVIPAAATWTAQGGRFRSGVPCDIADLCWRTAAGTPRAACREIGKNIELEIAVKDLNLFGGLRLPGYCRGDVDQHDAICR